MYINMVKKAMIRKNRLPKASVSQMAILSIFSGFIVFGVGMCELIYRLQSVR